MSDFISSFHKEKFMEWQLHINLLYYLYFIYNIFSQSLSL